MYRTAVIRMYDCLDLVIVNAVVTEYSETPGTAQPDVFAFSTSKAGVGDPNIYRWLYEGLRALATEAEAQ